ncbi:MAG: ribonuclease P protein component [Acholeplasmataceae bacterium]
MKKRYRIKKNSEIDAIFDLKQSKGNKFFVIYSTINNQNKNFRFAISIGKKYGSAVERNLMKRRIRMIISNLKDQLDSTLDFVIVVKPIAKTLNYQEIKQYIEELLYKNGEQKK